MSPPIPNPAEGSGLTRAIPAAGALLALAALASLPAQAQDTLVSNLDRASSASQINDEPRAQPFVTGSAAHGYTLHSIVLRLGSFDTNKVDSDELEVTIRGNTSNGRPGNVLHTLTNPSSLKILRGNEFTAPANAILAANTRYHVVAEYSSGPEKPFWSRVNQGVSEEGWSIPAQWYSFDDGSWTGESGRAMAIAVKGAEAPPRPTVSMAQVASPVEEGALAQFRVTRSVVTTGALRVRYKVSESGDMVFSVHEGANTIDFAGNEENKTISVLTQDDSAHEDDSTVTVTLTAHADYAIGDDDAATVTVEDDDDSPATGAVTITGTPMEGGTLTADISGIIDADGLANAAYAYQWARAPSGESGANIVGATSKTYMPVSEDVGATLKVEVTVTDDEGHTATFTSDATAAVAAGLKPTVTVTSNTRPITEGDNAVFTLARTGDTAAPLTVFLLISETGDMLPAAVKGDHQFTILIGRSERTLDLGTFADFVSEMDSVVTLALKPDAAYILGSPSSSAVTVQDDDGGGPQLPTVTVARVSSSVDEGANARFRVRRAGVTAGALTVRYSVSESGAMVASSQEGAKSVVLRSGEASRDVAVPTQDDGVSESDSRVTLRLAADAAYELGTPSSATVTVRDDDDDDDDGGGGPPTVSVVRLSLSVDEGADARFRLRRSGATAGALTVRYGVSESGDMVAPGDEGAKSVVLSSGETRRDVAVPTRDDDVSEADSRVTLRLAADPAYELGSPSSATVTVEDDEPPLPTLRVERVRSAVEEGGFARFRLLRGDVTEGALTVRYRVSESGDMVAPGDEGAKAVELRDGGARANLNVPTVDDGFSEADSVVTLELEADAAYSLGSPSSATVTVEDNDEGAPPPPAAAMVTPYLPPASAPGLEGFVRIVNHSGEAGEVSIEAIDDAGVSAGTVALSIAANATAQFNVPDLERGNPRKGIAEGVGAGQGGWRLAVTSALPVTALAYVRAADGLVSPLHDAAPAEGGGRHVAFFNPAGNLAQMSSLRLVNLGGRAAQVAVTGTDSTGAASAAATVALPAGGAAVLTAAELEAAIGDGRGKWRLAARSDEPILAMSLLSSPTGHLTNLSTVPARPGAGGAHVVPLFLSASDAFGRQGFVRVVNRSAEAGEVAIAAHDDSDFAYAPVTLAMGAGRSAHFNSDDLELGNAGKGLTGSTGPSAAGDWRLELSSALDIEVLAYVRTSDGFLTSVHDVAPTLADGSHWVAFFNPASNADQVSSLRLVNRGTEDALATVTGIDARGDSPGGAVALRVPAGASRTVTASELENGAEGLDGALGDGAGKWRLRVASDRPLLVMSLLASPAGHLMNISSAPAP